MSIEHCSSLSPSIRAKLQNAGLMWIDDIPQSKHHAGLGENTTTITIRKRRNKEEEKEEREEEESSHSLLSETLSSLLQRCPQLTHDEAVQVLQVIHIHRSAKTPTIRTLQEMIEIEETAGIERLTTFCGSLDLLLGGGVPVGAVCEVCGPPGVGKTQLLMQLAVNCALPAELGGLHGSCLFIDTEGSFVPERFREIVAAAVIQVKRITLRRESEGIYCGGVTIAGDDGLTVTSCSGNSNNSSNNNNTNNNNNDNNNSNNTSSNSNNNSGTTVSPTSRKRNRNETTQTSSMASIGEFFTLEYVLRETQYIRITDLVSLMAFLHMLPTYIASHPRIRMIVIDSIAFPFRSFTQFGTSLNNNNNNNKQQEGIIETIEMQEIHTSMEAKQLVWQRSRLLFSCGQILQQHAREHKLCIVVSNQVTSRTIDNSNNNNNNNNNNNSVEQSHLLVPALGDSWAYGLSTRLLLMQKHYTLGNHMIRESKEGCHENVVFIATPTINIDDVSGNSCNLDNNINCNNNNNNNSINNISNNSNSVVNAVQHRVARLVKSPTQPRGECCFSISQKGVRDVFRVEL